jgi:hypothetical protein
VSLRDRIPQDALADLDRYAANHVPVGDFLTAVLSNDLYGACRRADVANRVCLFDIAAYVELHLPIASRGGPEEVAEWTSYRVAT